MKTNNAVNEYEHLRPALDANDIADIACESVGFVLDEMHKGSLRTVGHSRRSTPDRIGDWLDNLRTERQHNEEYFNCQDNQGVT